MKLQLSVFAQDLKAEGGCNPFAVVAQVHPEPDKQPTVIGKTEVLKNKKDPDWTKIFILDNYQLGKPMHVIITIHDESSNESLGSAMFEVGAVLGTTGGILGKELKSGGLIMANVERCSGSGNLNFKMRGLDLQSKQEKVDAFFELQRKRKTVDGDVVWDCVFRSLPIVDSVNPIWDDACIELSALCNGKQGQEFRVAMKDYHDDGEKFSLIGYFRVSVNELLAAVTEGADGINVEDVNTQKAFVINGKGKTEVGKVVVISASTSGTEEAEDEIVVEAEEEIVVEAEEEIVVEASNTVDAVSDDDIDIVLEASELSDDIEIAPDELFGGPSFADYISGGCQLRVIVAIDYTASNGDPRKEESLHHFSKDKMNVYEKSISKICTILSEYDSDQKYPVWGFGGKRNGKIDHCFRCGEQEEADGVTGILEAYKQAFKAGIAMSSPTNITEVIRAAGKNARKCLDTAMESGNQEYSILIIFTNGSVHSAAETEAALDEVKDEPLSTVIVGVGPGDFSDMEFLNERCQRDDGGDRVKFVAIKVHDEDALAEETLKGIPQQLVGYFGSKGIRPNPPIETDEIVIEPFKEEEEVQANVVISDSGDVQVQSDAKPPEEPTPSKAQQLGKQGAGIAYTHGKRIFQSQFGRINKTMQRNFDKMVTQQVNQIFGITTPAKKQGKRR